jgi:endonuclease YncB( thermonuclease family)
MSLKSRHGKANSFLVVVMGIIVAVATLLLQRAKNEQESKPSTPNGEVTSPARSAHESAPASSEHDNPRLKKIKGFVSYVQDGDSLILRSGSEDKTIRLWGIDTPEGNSKQPYAEDARAFTNEICRRKHVTVLVHDRDRYHRFVGEVILPDGSSANEKIVSAGWAWHYEQHALHAKNLADAEKRAKEAKRGLWAGSNPIPPWEWRRQHPSHHR